MLATGDFNDWETFDEFLDNSDFGLRSVGLFVDIAREPIDRCRQPARLAARFQGGKRSLGGVSRLAILVT